MATASPRRQRPRLFEGTGEDRLSALPDDLLMLILHRLDTCSALAAAVLARRWARLPRRLRALDFRVTDILPPAYHESLALGVGNDSDLGDVIEGYGRCAMASYTDAINSFVEADVGDGREPRRVTRLRLEFFDPDEPVYVDRLIGTAVIMWGVEDLEVVVKPVRPLTGASLPRQNGRVAYRFPHECLCLAVESTQRIRSLTLGGCGVLPPLHEYGELTELVLQDITRPMRAKAYGSVFSWCPQLRSVHLRRCRTRGAGNNGLTLSVMEVDAPASKLRELVVDSCTFHAIQLLALPSLDRLACSGNPVMLTFGQVPRLARVNLSFSVVMDDDWYGDDDYTIDDLMGGSPASMTNLVVRFTGPQRWVTPGLGGETVFHALRRLLVADVPPTWDVSWPCLFLEVAPSLEALHANVDVSWCGEEDTPETENVVITWEPSKFRHRHLEELVLVGFERTPRRACLVRYAMKVCTALRRVVLVKGGRVDVKGLWGGWEVVARPREGDGAECPWSDEEKLAVGREIKKARYFKQYGKVVFA